MNMMVGVLVVGLSGAIVRVVKGGDGDDDVQ